MADAGPCASTRSWTHRTRRPVLRSTAGSRDAMGPTPSTALRLLSGLFGGDRVSRLTHSLQSATRARRDGATVDWVVAALVQDIGDLLAPENHRELAAAVLQPHVPDEVFWLVLTTACTSATTTPTTSAAIGTSGTASPTIRTTSAAWNSATDGISHRSTPTIRPIRSRPSRTPC